MAHSSGPEETASSTRRILRCGDKKCHSQPTIRIALGRSLRVRQYIPHVLENDTKDFIFLSLIGNHSSSPSIIMEQYRMRWRAGDFSGQPTIYDPERAAVCRGTRFRSRRISPQATALLGYVPLPNFTTTNRQNYHRLTTATNNTTTVGARYMRSLGAARRFST